MTDKKITSYPKEKVNILFLENISDAAVKRFSGAGYTSVKKMAKALPEAELIKEIADVHLSGYPVQNADIRKSAAGGKKTPGDRLFLYRGEPGGPEKCNETGDCGIQCALFQYTLSC